MKRAPFTALAIAALLAGCHAPQPPAAALPQPHYTLGAPWQAHGVWHYPRERFTYDETGLAEVVPDGHARLTADGEAFDAAALAASHATLQLPALARVTNLENGRQILVRLNDRGPQTPGRVIGLTRRAAELLAIRPGATAQVRMTLEEGPSRAMAEALRPAEPVSGLTAAPQVGVQAESLAPPGGVPSAPLPVRPVAARSAPHPAPDAPAAPAVPLRLPEQVTQVPAHPGQLWVRGADFSRMEYAVRQQAQLAGLRPRVEQVGQGRNARFRVFAGPFATAADADAALGRALSRGVSDARIVVE